MQRHLVRRVACRATLAGIAVASTAAGLSAPAQAATPTRWLCKPGLAANPCAGSLATTRVTQPVQTLAPVATAAARRPAIDCFYVYPTVSDQGTPQANLHVDPEERSIARFQAARFSQVCRVFAPMYRQATLAALGTGTITTAITKRAYGDVRDAWREYLRRDDEGRGVVVIGHSQGTRMLRQLVSEEIDPTPAVRRRLVSAVLLGGNVLVKRGKDTGGDFDHVAACRYTTQVGCVVAYSTFNETPPVNSRFGRPGSFVGIPAKAGTEVLCTNPAALAGGTANLDSIYPSAPFAPATTIGAVTPLVGFPVPVVPTPWLEADGAYSARCSAEGGAHVLRITPNAGAPTLKAIPDATWGLHLADVNIALGDLVNLVRTQAKAFAARSRG